MWQKALSMQRKLVSTQTVIWLNQGFINILYVVLVVRIWVMLMISNNQISKVLCVACQDRIGEHSKIQLWRCLFRLQGTYMQGKIEEDLPTKVEGEKVNARH